MRGVHALTCTGKASKNKCLVSHLCPHLFQGLRKEINVSLAWLEGGDFQRSPSV